MRLIFLAFLIPVLFNGHAELMKERFCSACEFIVDEIERRIEGSSGFDMQVGFRMEKKKKVKYMRSETHVMEVLDDEIELVLEKYRTTDENDSDDIQRTKKALTQVYRYMSDDYEEEMIEMFTQSMHHLDIKKRICLELTNICDQSTEMIVVLNVVDGKAHIDVNINSNGFTVIAPSSAQPGLRKGDLIVALNGISLVKKTMKQQTKIWKSNLINEALLTVERRNGLGFNVKALRDQVESFNHEIAKIERSGKKLLKEDPRVRILQEIKDRETRFLDILETNSVGLRAQMNLLIDNDDYKNAGKIDTKLADIEKMMTGLKRELTKTKKELNALLDKLGLKSAEEDTHDEL